MRRTKIIATLGPATNSSEMLEQAILAGVNLVRINMSHGDNKEREFWINKVRELSTNLKQEVGVLIDLQGPKIRVAKFKNKQVELQEGAKFTLDANLAQDQGDQNSVGIDYKELPKDLKEKDTLLLDDGKIILQVEKIVGGKIHSVVKTGGVLSSNKGLNRLGGGLSAQAITEKDKQDILFASKHEADYVALSFPRSKKDIEECRKLLVQAGSNAGIIAKIERAEALDNLEEIIAAADALMVARGDLGVEIGFAQLPAAQKQIIEQSHAAERAVIVATQMMESMICSPIPTRAEVSDVANAVVDGSDAVMLSAESATGEYPIKAIQAMDEICVAAEQQKLKQYFPDEEGIINIKQMMNNLLHKSFERTDQVVAMAAIYTANHLNVKAIIALTESGATTLWMSRISSHLPIYGVSRHSTARRKMTLFRGVYPIDLDVTKYKRWEVVREVITNLTEQGLLKSKEQVIITRGDITGIEGHTNTIKVITVE